MMPVDQWLFPITVAFSSALESAARPMSPSGWTAACQSEDVSAHVLQPSPIWLRPVEPVRLQVEVPITLMTHGIAAGPVNRQQTVLRIDGVDPFDAERVAAGRAAIIGLVEPRLRPGVAIWEIALEVVPAARVLVDGVVKKRLDVAAEPLLQAVPDSAALLSRVAVQMRVDASPTVRCQARDGAACAHGK